MSARERTDSARARARLHAKWQRKLSAENYYVRNINNRNALMCLSTAANSVHTDEFGFVMSYIVNNTEAIVAGSDWSIILRDHFLMARAITWIVTEFDTLSREIQENEQVKAVAFIARSLNRDGDGLDGDGDFV